MALSAKQLKVGDTHSEQVVDNLTRTQIVQYAGASGDYNPIHTDEAYTTKVAGYPSVFAHGMLTMGLTGTMLTNYVGDGRLTNGTCEPVPGAVAHYLGTETPRIVAEIAVPWQALGVDGPPAAGQLRMEIATTSYHRARWMSWSGLPPAVGLQDTAAWHTVRLGGR